mmetsp:Transcript_6441/g.9423  ORF Transcript_6441/g.9423 Transcript_6441/m.9423 type:complete len:171 (+) Transcript_6441:186-698(+)
MATLQVHQEAYAMVSEAACALHPLSVTIAASRIARIIVALMGIAVSSSPFRVVYAKMDTLVSTVACTSTLLTKLFITKIAFMISLVFTGDFCQYRECLNNCSYPNGVCNDSSGVCMCQPIFSPYNSQQIYVYWEGEDCSYLTAWFSACTAKPMPWRFVVAGFFIAAVFLV